MKVAFITGTGKGIGKSFAELLLSKKWRVYGFSKNNKIQNSNFYFTSIDLEKLNHLDKITFPELKNVTDILLLNNAANIGEIKSLEKKDCDRIIKEYNLNIISPTIICGKFLAKYRNYTKTILNISSGAAQTPIASWSTYCVSKSGLDMLTQVISNEKHENLKILSVYPGIVNTNMQSQIRSVSKENFPQVEKFIAYHAKNELESPENIARKLHHILENKDYFNENIVSLRDIKIK